MSKKKELKLRVWWFPPFPGPMFTVPINNPYGASVADIPEGMLTQAKLVLATLARYDLFHLENNIKGDYANVGGLEVWDDGEWVEWSNEDGRWINEIMREEGGWDIIEMREEAEEA